MLESTTMRAPGAVPCSGRARRRRGGCPRCGRASPPAGQAAAPSRAERLGSVDAGDVRQRKATWFSAAARSLGENRRPEPEMAK